MIIFKTASAAIWNRSESSSYIETHARPNPSQNSIANFSSWPKVESYEVGLIKSECRQFSLPRILAAMCNSIIWNGRRKTEWGNGARNRLQNLNSWMSRILKDANSDVFKKSNSSLIESHPLDDLDLVLFQQMHWTASVDRMSQYYLSKMFVSFASHDLEVSWAVKSQCPIMGLTPCSFAVKLKFAVSIAATVFTGIPRHVLKWKNVFT